MTPRTSSALDPSKVYPRLRSGMALLVLPLAFLFGACATGSGPATTEEAPGGARPETETMDGGPEIPSSLRPTDDARAIADTATLTGQELGTMWTFENPPRARWRERYGFSPDAAWLEHVREASLRYGEFCSASFVSPRGLVMTNHHCARSCVEDVSTGEHDYVEEGFYAESREDEKVCPGLSLDQLVSIEEVTERVRAAAPADGTDEEVAEAREEEQEAVVEACEEDTDLHCQVVSLYHGGQYQLYRYRRYSPVKLVFAPELQAGFFGGVPDNFAYPRFALDVAFVRAYRPDSTTAVEPEHYFEWDPEGAEEGEPIFITGNPGSTSRLATVSQLMYERTYRHPFRLQFFKQQRAFLQEIAEMGPEAERQVRQNLFQLDNVIELYEGELAGLRDEGLIGHKIRWESRFRDSVQSDPELRGEYGDAWDRMAEIQARKLEISPPLNMNNPGFVGSPHLRLAADLVNWIRQSALPAGERDEEFDETSLSELESRLRGSTSPNPQRSIRLFRIRLALADRWLAPDDPFRQDAFRSGESPRQAARRLVSNTKVGSSSFRKRLMDAGLAALDTVSDPLVRLADNMIRRHDELEPRWDEVTASESVQEERLARALFEVFGTQLPPDATFTLRITDGVVKSYPYNGTRAPARTSFYGLYARSAEFGNEEPFNLPHSFEGKQGALDLSTPFDFVSTNDITGGNSGSPVIDREAQVVGVAFDGNHEQLPNEFLFRPGSGARTVSVHSAGITEALRSVYEAERLVEELTGDGGDGGR